MKEKNGFDIAKGVIEVLTKGVWFVFAIIIVFSFFSGPSTVKEVYKKGGPEKIVILPVEGTIMDGQTEGYVHERFLAQLDEAFKSDNVKCVMLKLDTPGGGVLESEEVHSKIVKLKAMYGKPLVVYMHSMAASGGYYISTPADKIVANKNTITGSLGVIMEGINISGLAEKYGIKMDVIKSGEYKDIMSSFKEMTPEEREIMQSLVDESYQGFVDVISEGRKIPREEVLKIADGRVYSAKQAKELNLIDEIGDMDVAIKVAEQLIGVENATVIQVKEISSSMMGMLGKAATFISAPSIESQLLHLMSNKSGIRYEMLNNGMRPQYLYAQ